MDDEVGFVVGWHSAGDGVGAFGEGEKVVGKAGVGGGVVFDEDEVGGGVGGDIDGAGGGGLWGYFFYANVGFFYGDVAEVEVF